MELKQTINTGLAARPPQPLTLMLISVVSGKIADTFTRKSDHYASGFSLMCYYISKWCSRCKCCFSLSVLPPAFYHLMMFCSRYCERWGLLQNKTSAAARRCILQNCSLKPQRVADTGNVKQAANMQENRNGLIVICGENRKVPASSLDPSLEAKHWWQARAVTSTAFKAWPQNMNDSFVTVHSYI